MSLFKSPESVTNYMININIEKYNIGIPIRLANGSHAEENN